MGRADRGLERGMSLRMLGTAKPGQLTPGKIPLELFGERWGWLGRATGAGWGGRLGPSEWKVYFSLFCELFPPGRLCH